MFKIDKSSVEYIDSNKSAVVIKYWSPQERKFEENTGRQDMPENEKKNLQTSQEKSETGKVGVNPDIILEQARKEAEKIKTSAWSEGYNRGLEEAKKLLNSFLTQQKMKVDRAISEAEKIQEDITKELEECVLQLSFDIAEKIVNIHLEKDDILFVGTVKKAIEKLNAKEKFIIRLNESQFNKYFQGGSDWLIEEMQCAPFTAVKDPGVAPYGCVLESEEGIIDAGIENQLKMAKRIFGKEESQDDEIL